MSRFLPLKQYSGLSYAYDQRTGFYRARIPSENALDKATAYSVVFAGKQYNYSAPKNGALGNASLYDRRFPDTGEPFYFAPAMGMVTSDQSGIKGLSYGILKDDEVGDLEGLAEEVERLSEEIAELKGEKKEPVTYVPDLLGYLKLDGSLVTYDTYYHTDYIPLDGYVRIVAKAYLGTSGCALAFFDSGKVLLTELSIAGLGGTGKPNNIDMDVPSGASYCMLSNFFGSANSNADAFITLYPSAEEDDNDIADNANPIKGKRFAVLGDSISSVNYTLPVWWQLIAEKYGCEFVNYGVSASRIAVSDATVLSFTERYATMDDSVDGVVVVGGTNDVWYTPIGAFDSADNTTLNGALNEMLPGLLNKYPGKPVLFFAPIQREDYTESDYPVTVADLKALDVTTVIGRDRVNLAIMVKCRQYGVPCVDLYTACGINGNDANSVYFRTDDNLHPSALGMQRIAGVVAAEMVKHFNFVVAGDVPGAPDDDEGNTEGQVTYTSGVAGYVATDGTMSTNSEAWRTDYLALDGVTRIVAQYRLTNSGYALAFYDSNKVLMPDVSIVGADVNKDNTIDVVPPANAAYCIFSHYAGWNKVAGWVTLYS